jgi:molybdate transport system permease protein
LNIPDLGPLLLTLQLAAVTTIILMLISTPFAWWLAHTRSRWKPAIEAVTALPLVLPPTVLGFYLLILMSPNSAVGGAWVNLTGETLTFSFTGLVIASMIYSLPFAVQPLQAAFEQAGLRSVEAATTLGAGPLDRFFTVALPMAKRGMLTAAILTFAHTIGEFGVVLMVGGNIPGQTKVISIAIYEHVETIRYTEAHVLSALLLAFSFAVLLVVYVANRRAGLAAP